MRKPMHKLAASHIFVNAKKLREQRTPAEIVLWEALREKQVEGFRFRQQHPIEDYILDFYCPSEKLCVELDGAGHFTDDGLKYDEERTRYLNSFGIRVIRFENNDVFDHTDYVLERIKSYFSKDSPPF